jgi:glycosyltransferase involved in cell wall biosynthesis
MLEKSEHDIMKNWDPKEEIRVSCCCVAYNHEKYIEEALDSVLMQETNFPFEIIIRDDCSTDATQAIIKRYAKKYPTLIKAILETENQYSQGIKPGPAIFQYVKGKYIALLETDDYWNDPNKLQIQTEFLEAHKDYVISYHDCTLIDKDGEVIATTINPNLQDYSSDALKCGDIFIHPNTTLFRNVSIHFTKIFDDILNGDTVLFHLLGFYGHGKFQKEIKNSIYRVHGHGIWSSLDRVEKMKNNIKTKQALQKNLINKPILIAKIEENINHSLLSHLRQSLAEKDLHAYLQIIGYILSNREIHRRILWQHIQDTLYRLRKKSLQ